MTDSTNTTIPSDPAQWHHWAKERSGRIDEMIASFGAFDPARFVEMSDECAMEHTVTIHLGRNERGVCTYFGAERTHAEKEAALLVWFNSDKANLSRLADHLIQVGRVAFYQSEPRPPRRKHR